MSTTSQPPAGDAGTTVQDQRFHDESSVQRPEDVTDPGSLDHEDDDSTSWKQKLKDRKVVAIPLIIIAIALTMLAFSQLVRWVPELLSSRRFQLFVAFSGAIGLTFWFTHKRSRAKIEEKDWLVLKDDNNDDAEYWIEYVPGGKTVPPRAILMKDAGRFDTKKEPLTLEELDPSIARKWAAEDPDNSEDDPAMIWLMDQFLAKSETDRGTSYIQATSGLQVDSFGQTAFLAAKPPERAGKEQLMEYEKALSALRDEVAHLQDKEQRLQRHLSEMKDIDDPLDERFDEFIQRMVAIMSANDRRRSTKRTGDERDPLTSDLEEGLFNED